MPQLPRQARRVAALLRRVVHPRVVGLDVADVALSACKGRLRVRGKGRDGGKLRELPWIAPSCVLPCSPGSNSARTGPAPATARRCCSTAAVAGFPIVPREPSSPTSASTLASAPTRSADLVHTPCGTPSRPSCCAKAPTRCSSPICSVTPACPPCVPTPNPPTRTGHARFLCSPATVDQYGPRSGTAPACSYTSTGPK